MMIAKTNNLCKNEWDLTYSELQILRYIKKGFSSYEISKLRNGSKRTVEKHRSNIIKKLGISSSQNTLIIWILNHPEVLDT
jgi:DNA-binding CsgD family transcriptional regulator